MSKKYDTIKKAILEQLEIEKEDATAKYKAQVVPKSNSRRLQVVCNTPELLIIRELDSKLLTMGLKLNTSQLIRLFLHNINPAIDLNKEARKILACDRRNGYSYPCENFPLQPIYDKKLQPPSA